MPAAEIVLLAVWCFLVAAAGGLVGLVLGNIRLPVVLLVAAVPAAGAGANIAISGVTALAALAVHWRAARVNWRLVAVMAPPSAAGAVAGGLLAGTLPSDVLLAVIGVVLLGFGADLVRPRSGGPARSDGEGSGPDLVAAAVSGGVIGILGGLVGLILGSLRMPALVRWVGEDPSIAVGTNLAVGVVVGAAGLAGHLPSGVDVTVLVVGAAASVPGALLGARLTGRLSEAALLRAIGVMLLVAGGATLVQALV